MSKRFWVALCIALLAHGLLFLRAGAADHAEQLPPGEGQGITAEAVAVAGAPKPAVPAIRLAAPLSAPISREGAGTGTGTGMLGGGNSYLGRVRAHLDQRARALAGTMTGHGVVELRFNVARDGTASGVELVASSGDSALDRAALALVQGGPPLPPPLQPLRLRVPIEFR